MSDHKDKSSKNKKRRVTPPPIVQPQQSNSDSHSVDDRLSCRVSDNEFDGESNVTPPTGRNTTHAMSYVPVVTHPLLIPPREQDEDLKEEEKISYGEI